MNDETTRKPIMLDAYESTFLIDFLEFVIFGKSEHYAPVVMADQFLDRDRDMARRITEAIYDASVTR